MSGSGFKDFQAGDVLTEAEVDGYLMKQAVMYFADAAARDSAITSPEEGMHAYLADSDQITYYDGSSWLVLLGAYDLTDLSNVDTSGLAQGALLYYDGTDWVDLGIGTAGQQLQVNSGATAPEWADSGSSVDSSTKSANHTFELADAGTVVEADAALTFTIPTNAAVAFATGTIIEVFADTTGTVTVAPDTGVTLESPDGTTGSRDLSGQFAGASLRKRATDTWAIQGSLA